MTDDPDMNGGDDDAMQTLIGQQLRLMYDAILSEPIPDRIVELLVRLDSIDVPPAQDDAEGAEGQ